MPEAKLSELFTQWWKESFPNAPIGKHALSTHIAFAQYLLSEIGYEQQQKEQQT